MSHKTLPHFQCLRATYATLSNALQADPALATPCAIAGRLLDRMIVEDTAGLALKTGCYEALSALLPPIERLLASQPPTRSAVNVAVSPDVEKLAPGSAATDMVRELQTICAAADASLFDRFAALAGALQRELLALGTPEALTLTKAIVQVEIDYSRKLDEAVVEQAARTAAANKTASSVRNNRELDQKALVDFIRQTFPDETDVTIKQSNAVSGGYSKFTVSITLANAKSLPENIILRGDASATFGGVSVVDEYRLIKTMYENGVSVPKPIALEQSGKVFGSPFLLVDKKPGTVIGHMFNLPAKPNKSILEDVAAKLAAIHRVPLAAVGNQIDGANGKNPRSSDKALAWIEEGLNAWRPLNMPSTVFETSFDWLRRHATINDKVPRTLVHGDYGLNNLLIDNDKVSTILDWEFAHIGNPAYDLGYFYFMAKSLGEWDDFLQAYGRAGMPVPDEEQINYNILLAATRLGVMVCQTASIFTSGAEPGLAGAAVLGGGFYEETIKRVSGALQRVL